MSQEGGAGDGSSSSVRVESPREKNFNQFYDATDFQEILQSFRALCEEIGVYPSEHDGFYASLKRELTAWKCRALWQLLDSRASLPEYESQKACEGKRVLVVGAGPVGLRAAIEAALLGARVDVVEKRSSFSRNNSLHLWPFLITDLRNLGAKKFYGRFCSGAIDHICIRILQSILLKVCLLLGIKVHPAVTFTGLLEPNNANSGWSVTTTPTTSPVSTHHYDVIFAADGKQNSLPGFRSKEFRAKLALAITANFVNSGTKQEASVPEISGVAYVYNQGFFNTLAETLGIELENIVYYKDETHYFVMTAKKPSLLKKGVIKKDHNDPRELLSPQNLDRKALERYAIEAVAFSTEGALEGLPFEKNHRGENDVALFDFTSLFAAENAARIVERKGRRALLCVVGDSLLEPFWPTGTGCARGFLGAFDAAWMMKRFCAGVSPLELLEEREAMYYLLPQTTPERLQKNFTGYTIDPKTRYLSLGELVAPGAISHLYDSDVHPAPPLQSTNPTAAATKPVQAAKGHGIEDRKVRSRTITLGSRSKSIEGLALSAPSAAEPAHGDKPINSANDRSSPAPAKAASTHSPKPKFKPWGRKEPTLANVSPVKPTSASEAGSGHDKQHKSEKGPTKPESVKAKPTTKESSPASGPKAGMATRESPSRKPGKQPHTTRSEPSSKKSSSPKWLSSSKKAASHEPPKKQETESASTPATVPSEEPEPEHLQSVAEIVQQLNQPPPTARGGATAPSSVAGKKKETGKHKSGKKEDKEKMESKKSSGKTAPKPKAEKKERERERPAGDDKKKEVNKPKDSTHWWTKLPFLKHKKSYDVTSKEASGATSSPKHKRRSEKHPAKVEEPKPPSIHARIEQLKQKGVGADITDNPDAVVTDGAMEEGDSEQRQPISGTEVPEGSEHQVADGTPELQRELVAEDKVVLQPERELKSEAAVPVRDGPVPVEEGLEDRLAAEAEEEAVRSKLESGSDGEERTSVVEHNIRKLQPFFETKTAGPSWKARDLKDRRSKEIDLADLELHIGETKPDTTNPLWMARKIQSLNKQLERLRKDNDVMTAKTALVILNTIFSNIQNYPDDDRYRRVRISSKRFHRKVWQHSEARQFLARAGWVEIDDFVVLPIGKKVNIPMQALDKHLNIVNQMLWSQQLELPDSPGVLRIMRENRFRGKSASVCRRESYATRVVNESMERVDQDRVAMAAARMKQLSPGGGGVALPLLPLLEEAEEGPRKSSPDPTELSAVREDRAEEVATMKAASAARDIWHQRDRKDSMIAWKEREYKIILESELYDLAPRKEEALTKLAEEAKEGGKRLEEDTRASQSPRTSPDNPQSSGDVVVLRHPKHESQSPDDPAGAEPRSQRPLSQQEMLEATVAASESARQVWMQKISTPDIATTSPSTSKEPSPSPTSIPNENVTTISTSPPPQSKAEPPSTPPRTPTPVTVSMATTSSEGRVESPVADAQSATLSSIRSDIIEYERIAMESAAQVRQKWMQAEASATGDPTEAKGPLLEEEAIEHFRA